MNRQITNNAQRSPIEAQLTEWRTTNPWAVIDMQADRIVALEKHVIELIAECDRLRSAVEREKEERH